MSNSPDLNLCFCDKMCVERSWYYGRDAGRRYLNCSNGRGGCGYICWVEEPLEERAARVVEELQKELVRERNRHRDEMHQMMTSFNIHHQTGDEDEVESANPPAGLDDSTDENKNEYEDSVKEDEEDDDDDDDDDDED